MARERLDCKIGANSWIFLNRYDGSSLDPSHARVLSPRYLITYPRSDDISANLGTNFLEIRLHCSHQALEDVAPVLLPQLVLESILLPQLVSESIR
jgi:hypothetical protein